MDVSLVSPVSRANSQIPPLSLMYIAAYLEKHKIKTNIIDAKSDPYKLFDVREKRIVANKIIKKIKECEPKIIGITCMCTEVNEVLQLSKSLNQKHDSVIVVGGVQPTLCPHDFLYKKSPVDYVVMGEGEETMLELAQKIISNQDVTHIKGIAYFKEKLIVTEPRPFIKNLDDLPFPAYELVDMDYYLRPNIRSIRPIFLSQFSVFAGRGCPYNCRFCATIFWKRTVRLRSYKNVVDEIEYLVKKYSIDGVYITDDTFAINRERLLSFCSELKRRKLDIIWGCQTRVHLIKEDLVKAMKAAGCIQMEFGVESGSQKMLDNLNKGITVKQIKEAFKLCQKYKIRTYANIMFNTIDETEDDVKKTLDLCKEIKADVYGFAIMTPYPKTDIYNNIKPLTVDEYSLYDDAISVLHPRFKFAKHDINLEKLLKELFKEYRAYRSTISSFSNLKYIQKLIRSKRKKEYFLGFLLLAKFWLPRLWSKYLESIPFFNKRKDRTIEEIYEKYNG